MAVTCDYCGNQTQLVGGLIVYPWRTDLASKKFWCCKRCEAWVGCHPNTEQPLGRLAGKELRRLKMEAHAAFDPIWKGGAMKRKDAYAWLSQKLGLERHDTHIGMFDEDKCRQVIAACTDWRRQSQSLLKVEAEGLG